MGGIIFDGRASLRFKGPVANLKKALVALDSVPLPENLKVELVPVCTSADQQIQTFAAQITVNKVALKDFAETMAKAELVAKKLIAMGWIIDTCPPLPQPWPWPGPTPEVEEGLSTWVITIIQQ